VREMTTEVRLGIVVALGAIGAAIAQLVDPGGSAVVLVVLAAGIVGGELFVLRPAMRAALPLSYAVILVVLRAGSPAEFMVTVFAAELVAFGLRSEPTVWDRVWVTARRLGAAAAALCVYQLVNDAMHGGDGRWAVLVALSGAGAAEILVDDLLHVVRARRFYLSIRGRSADLALVTSGVLMSVVFKGIDGHTGAGLGGALLLSIPLLAAWYSFERLASIRRTYGQTISALSVVPELAGLVREGHAQRVADLSMRLGADLGLSGLDLEYLRAAALLHHLGHLCLDDPEVRGRAIEPSEVTDKGAEILRQTEYLHPAGDLLASDTASVGSQILRVASAFDELTAGDPAFNDAAIEALYSGPGYVYDPRVLDALERVAGVEAKVPIL
jgi:HD domain